jgi:hypothetical protein
MRVGLSKSNTIKKAPPELTSGAILIGRLARVRARRAHPLVTLAYRQTRPTITCFECHCVAALYFPCSSSHRVKRLNEKNPTLFRRMGFYRVLYNKEGRLAMVRTRRARPLVTLACGKLALLSHDLNATAWLLFISHARVVIALSA